MPAPVPDAPPPATLAIFSKGVTIGDGFFQLPFLHELRHRLPDTHITWMTARYNIYASTLREVVMPGLLDAVEEWSGFGSVYGKAGVVAEIFARGEKPELRFDAVISAKNNLWRALSVRRHFDTPLFLCHAGGWLISAKPPPRWRDRLNPHLTDNLYKMLDIIAPPKPTPPPLQLPLDPYRKEAARLLPEGKRYVGFVPGSGVLDKRWPLENFIALMRQTKAAGFEPVVFLGPGEEDLHAPLRQVFPNLLIPERQAPEALRHPLLVTALGERLHCAVANDSGPAHMLALAAKPMIVLYGKYSPHVWAPRIPDIDVFWSLRYGAKKNMAKIPLRVVAACLQKKLL